MTAGPPNGVPSTLLSHSVTISEGSLRLDGVSVVNGCQSLVSLFDNQQKLTPELRVLVKLVLIGDNQGLESLITYRSNNQNPVNIRDQRSTHIFQLDLQGHVRDNYADVMFYAIREGEVPTAPDVLDNRLAAQMLMAIWLKEPWAAVRKVRLFDADYHRIFARYVDAHKLRLAFLLDRLIAQRRSALAPELQASFASVRFTIAYLIAQVLRQSANGAELFNAPERWLLDAEGDLMDELGPLADRVIDSVNVYIDGRKELAPDDEPFDPKVVFKSSTGVRDLEFQVTQAQRLFDRQAERLGESPGLRLQPTR